MDLEESDVLCGKCKVVVGRRFSWVPENGLTDSPEKRFILAMILQTVQDAADIGDVPDEDKGNPEHVKEMEELAKWVTSERFSWWCEALAIKSHRMASIIMDVMRGRWQVNKRQLRIGIYHEDYEFNGFACWEDKEKHRVVSLMAGKISAEKRRNERRQKQRDSFTSPAVEAVRQFEDKVAEQESYDPVRSMPPWIVGDS